MRPGKESHIATCTLEFTTQVKYVSPPGAKFMTAHLHGQTARSACISGLAPKDILSNFSRKGCSFCRYMVLLHIAGCSPAREEGGGVMIDVQESDLTLILLQYHD